MYLGYPITQYAIRPFSDNDLTNNARVSRTRKLWNQAFSKERVVVEHAFGQLKGRFPSVRVMPGWNLDRIYRAIEALMVVHNICVDLRDSVEDIVGVNLGDELIRPDEPDRNARPVAEDLGLRAGGLDRRKQLVDYWALHR